MKSVTTELLKIVAEFEQKISAITENEFAAKPLANKWSKKEVLGHLIDSAQNNLRRFIVGQYADQPPKITYEQDFWVIANGYQQMTKADVIAYWRLINQRIAAVLDNMPKANYLKKADSGKEKPELHELEWLAADYVKHLKHHLNQIIPNSFDIVYK